MIRMVRNVAATLAIASLAIAQPAMAVRSSDSLPVVGAKVVSTQGHRVGSRVGNAEELRGGSIIPVVAIVAIILGILALTYGKHDGNAHQSPG